MSIAIVILTNTVLFISCWFYLCAIFNTKRKYTMWPGWGVRLTTSGLQLLPTDPWSSAYKSPTTMKYSWIWTALFITDSYSHPRQEALTSAISEKDANIALLEMTSTKKQRNMEEIDKLSREKDKLNTQLKELVGLL